MLEINKSSWIEEIYGYVEYYYWEPQHLNKQSKTTGAEAFKQVRARMRSMEVPLNAIFNITLRLLPSRIISNLLNLFYKADFGKEFLLLNRLALVNDMGNFAQPDITLETETSRIFIETKINHKFSLDQSYKYLFLHAIWRQKTGISKKPYVLLLSKSDIYSAWAPKERSEIFEVDKTATSVVSYIKNNPLPLKLGCINYTLHLHEDVKQILESLVIASTTWQSVGSFLQKEIENTSQVCNENQEVINKLILDLLTELKNRKLFLLEGKV